MSKDFIDHIAVEVKNVDAAVKWYSEKFNCNVKYQ
ncbi:MAG: VOC family protein, partial [Candidatus Marinimicrobia bacterium]|nr:VOC family protein [Candidatus Neomarinimicrobiota bacterium]